MAIMTDKALWVTSNKKQKPKMNPLEQREEVTDSYYLQEVKSSR